MGYQESYFRIKNSNDFDKLVTAIKANKQDDFNCAEPVEIITLQKPIHGTLKYMCRPDELYKFNAGEKFVYVVGERYNQRNARNFFENCKIKPKDIINNTEIYFTECFPSNDIFENNDKTHMAKHEEFKWE